MPQASDHTSENQQQVIRQYKRFKYHDQEFRINDVCRFMVQDQPDLLGKITQILSTDPNHKDFAKLKVQWLY